MCLRRYYVEFIAFETEEASAGQREADTLLAKTLFGMEYVPRRVNSMLPKKWFKDLERYPFNFVDPVVLS